MASNAIAVAEAVVAELNLDTQPWFGRFTASRGWLPVYSLDQLADLTVTVVPDRRHGEKFNRRQTRYSYEVVIDFQQAAKALTLTDLDSLVSLIDGDITAWFQDWHYLAGLDETQAPASQWTVNDVQLVEDELYRLDRLYDEGIFEAALVLQIKGNQP